MSALLGYGPSCLGGNPSRQWLGEHRPSGRLLKNLHFVFTLMTPTGHSSGDQEAFRWKLHSFRNPGFLQFFVQHRGGHETAQGPQDLKVTSPKVLEASVSGMHKAHLIHKDSCHKVQTCATQNDS